MVSKGIESFLDFLREANTQLNIAVMIEQETNDQTQDILHRLELQEHTYHEYAAHSKELKTIRKERRKAKDEIACLSPIVTWAEDNKSVVKGLEQLLGTVRKAERSTEQRIYTPRGETQWKVKNGCLIPVKPLRSKHILQKSSLAVLPRNLVTISCILTL